jgi:glyoxylase-like metal-dependent hydrolase (beta-lactamase superfamily II)
LRARNILEGWAHEVIERVAKRALVGEDDLIEFKREWIEPHRAARRIAAHANAARGHEILWLIGVDPNAADPFFALSDSKPEQWFDQVKAFFVDGHHPGFQCFQVPYRDKAVYAIVFDTSGFPFLISLKAI